MRLGDVHGATTAAAVVIGVVVAPPFRPARRQRLAARLATRIPAQREGRIVALPWTGHLVATVEDRLDAEEDPLSDQRFEVATLRDVEVRHVDLADVNAVPQHRVECLRRYRFATP